MRDDRQAVATRLGLAHGRRERRWTTIVDGVLVVAVLAWLATSLTAYGQGHPTTRWVLSLLLLAFAVHRVVLLVERRRSRGRDTGAGRATVTAVNAVRRPVTRAGRSHAA